MAESAKLYSFAIALLAYGAGTLYWSISSAWSPAPLVGLVLITALPLAIIVLLPRLTGASLAEAWQMFKQPFAYVSFGVFTGLLSVIAILFGIRML